ncbi:MAG TPA: NYN domain-containing protein [Kamptonema sp.]|nr:NYN domain-containing protein [Kamptonema sp.]
MQDSSSLPVTQKSVIISAISRHLCETLISIQQQHPEWIAEKYRKTPWHGVKTQSALTEKLTAGLSEAADTRSLLAIAKKYLQILLVPEFINSPQFSQLFREINQLASSTIQASPLNKSAFLNPNSSSNNGSQPPPGIAILLLDAENLQIDVATEKLLQGICIYPLQIKVAFANWRSLGKKDAEFHERGYQLIHVPPGKDSADLKMATVGASIFVHYPTAKEILVCSSDRALTHLRNTLQAHGLTVYQVRKQRDYITVLNSQTGQTRKYSVAPLPEIPPLEQFILQLKELIKAEQERTANQWVKLSQISVLYNKNYNLTLNQVSATHLPGSQVQDIFINHPMEFVVHQISDSSPIYITIFSIVPPTIQDSSTNTIVAIKDIAIPQNLSDITSIEELQVAIVNIVENLTATSSSGYVFVANVGSEFYQRYAKPITQVIKEFNLTSKFPKFLHSCSDLKLKKTAKGWQVGLVKP